MLFFSSSSSNLPFAYTLHLCLYCVWALGNWSNLWIISSCPAFLERADVRKGLKMFGSSMPRACHSMPRSWLLAVSCLIVSNGSTDGRPTNNFTSGLLKMMWRTTWGYSWSWLTIFPVPPTRWRLQIRQRPSNLSCTKLLNFGALTTRSVPMMIRRFLVIWFIV